MIIMLQKSFIEVADGTCQTEDWFESWSDERARVYRCFKS